MPALFVTLNFTTDESFDFFNATVAPERILPCSSFILPEICCANVIAVVNTQTSIKKKLLIMNLFGGQIYKIYKIVFRLECERQYF